MTFLYHLKSQAIINKILKALQKKGLLKFYTLKTGYLFTASSLACMESSFT